MLPSPSPLPPVPSPSPDASPSPSPEASPSPSPDASPSPIASPLPLPPVPAHCTAVATPNFAAGMNEFVVPNYKGMPRVQAGDVLTELLITRIHFQMCVRVPEACQLSTSGRIATRDELYLMFWVERLIVCDGALPSPDASPLPDASPSPSPDAPSPFESPSDLPPVPAHCVGARAPHH